MQDQTHDPNGFDPHTHKNDAEKLAKKMPDTLDAHDGKALGAHDGEALDDHDGETLDQAPDSLNNQDSNLEHAASNNADLDSLELQDSATDAAGTSEEAASAQDSEASPAILHKNVFKNLAEQTKEKTHHKNHKHHKAFSIVKAVVYLVILVIVLTALAFVGYAAYLESHYSRIADNKMLKIESPRTDLQGDQPQQVSYDTTYTLTTYNVGFGAYTPDYTFFMDKGVMKDGTPKQGVHGKAVSLESVEAATQGSIATIAQAANGSAPDFMFFQEIDTDSDRSYHVNQVKAVKDTFSTYESSFASNFHSGFLAYPLHDMHGKVNSGILTLSRVNMINSIRRSYPVTTDFPDKYFDLDRCFQITRYTLPDKHSLVLINSHMSAYDKGGKFRAAQLKMLTDTLVSEYAKGNYVIAGGDWNHALCDSLELYPSEQGIPDWVKPLNASDLPQGFTCVAADNLSEVPTCRGDDIAYEKGVTYTTTVDGFIVSNNIEAQAHNIDTGFATSDHNPVLLTFKLKAAA